MQRNNSSQSRYLTTRIDIKRVINEELGKNKIIPRSVKTFRDESRNYLASKAIGKELTPLRSLGAEEVRELLRNEKKKEQEKFTLNKKTRDISYFKDTFFLQATPSEPILSTHDLPTDINHIKKILVTSDYKGVPTAYSPSGFSNPVPCKREHCVERALATHHNAVRPSKANILPSIAVETDRTYENLMSTMTPNPGDSLERLYLGNPTGRQDIENLWKWFSFMKAKYDSENNAEAIEAIYEICSREIIRQVSVQCVERGTLLTEVIMRWPQIANNKVEKLLDEMTQLKVKHSIELQDLAAQKDKEMALFKVSVQEIKDQAQLEKELRKSAEEKLAIIKNKLAGVERKYAAEEELWKKISLQKPVLNHKKNIAKSPQKVSMTSEIKWKEEERQIENVIDIQAIEALKGIMTKPELLEISKKQQEEEEKFQEKNAQTDYSEMFLFEDKETQTEVFEEEAWKIIKTAEESNLPTDNAGISIGIVDETPKIPNLKEAIKGIGENNKNSLDSDRSEKFITAFTISNIEDFREERENLDKSINESQENDEEISEIKDEVSMMRSQISMKSSESNVNSPRNDQSASKKTPIKSTQESRKQSLTKPHQKMKTLQKNPQTPEKAQTPRNSQSNASSFKKSTGKRSSVSFVDQLASHLHSVDKLSQEERLMFFAKLSPEDKQYFVNKFSQDDRQMMMVKEALLKEITEQFEHKSKELASLLSDLEKKKDILELLKLELYAKQSELENFQESIKPEHREEHERSETVPPIRVSPANESEISKDLLAVKNSSRDRSGSFDSISSNKAIYLKIPDQPSKNFQFESNPNSFTELIPSGSDLGSWKAGWSSGYEKGRSEGIKNGEKLGFEDGYTEGYLKAIQEAKGSQLSSDTYAEDIWQDEENKEAQEKSIQPAEEIEDQDSELDFACEGKRLPLDYFFVEKNRDKKKIKEITKFMEFHFHKPLYLTQPKKPSVAPQLLNALLTKKTSIITKKATMSRRMCSRLASSIYQDCYTKFKNGEQFPSLFEVTYDQFIHKYGLKTVAEKKLIEFIASLMKYSEYARPLLFLRFAGASSKIDNHDYSKLSFLFYLQSLNFMLNAKIGIVVGYDDSADRQMFPTVRAIECLRDKFDGILERSIITALISIVEQRSITDPKRINSAGLVELEFLLELMVENYENYQNAIGEGIVFIISALGIERQEFITKQEFYILTRHVSPGKLRDDENTTKDFVPRLKLHPELISNQLDKMEKINFSDLISICIERNLLSITDVKNFCKFNKELTLDQAKEEMNKSKDEIFEMLEVIKNSPEKKWKSYDDYIFEEKLRHLLNIRHTEKPNYVLFNWKLLEAELRRIKKDYVQENQN
ncbi:unnamed protein product [Blepharisma stoltei]|uniref:Essential protein Yae1 N-terminal domain-containing protein n=1 Tax=Blepharisma stoltei TaxID=1481888 RepID=A0AAU9JU12_9CILI|nr:unnamed protein product [Blepharisma stoltei]